MVNDVSDEVQVGICKEKGTRTNIGEITDLIKSQKIIVVTIEGNLAGCIAISTVNAEIAAFRMLNVVPEYRKRGIGSILVETVQTKVKSDGFMIIQLELLSPRTWSSPALDFLKVRYTK